MSGKLEPSGPFVRIHTSRGPPPLEMQWHVRDDEEGGEGAAVSASEIYGQKFGHICLELADVAAATVLLCLLSQPQMLLRSTKYTLALLSLSIRRWRVQV